LLALIHLYLHFVDFFFLLCLHIQDELRLHADSGFRVLGFGFSPTNIKFFRHIPITKLSNRSHRHPPPA
jgi:hypothetical protein